MSRMMIFQKIIAMISAEECRETGKMGSKIEMYQNLEVRREMKEV